MIRDCKDVLIQIVQEAVEEGWKPSLLGEGPWQPVLEGTTSWCGKGRNQKSHKKEETSDQKGKEEEDTQTMQNECRIGIRLI